MLEHYHSALTQRAISPVYNPYILTEVNKIEADIHKRAEVSVWLWNYSFSFKHMEDFCDLWWH